MGTYVCRLIYYIYIWKGSIFVLNLSKSGETSLPLLVEEIEITHCVTTSLLIVKTFLFGMQWLFRAVPASGEIPACYYLGLLVHLGTLMIKPIFLGRHVIFSSQVISSFLGFIQTVRVSSVLLGILILWASFWSSNCLIFYTTLLSLQVFILTLQDLVQLLLNLGLLRKHCHSTFTWISLELFIR